MEERATRHAVLVRFYQRYLNDGETARFIASVATRYTSATLERLLVHGDLHSRRAAAMALGLIGDHRSYEILGPTLQDDDRKLRLVVDDAVRAISSREGNHHQRHQLELIVRSNECGTFDKSVELATELIEQSGGTAEAYHQRSLAFFQKDAIDEAIEDCQEVLKLNPYHYAAMVGLGHCHLELGYLMDALDWFRKAVETYPDLEPIRVQIKRLERAIQEL